MATTTNAESATTMTSPVGYVGTVTRAVVTVRGPTVVEVVEVENVDIAELEDAE